MVTLPRRVCSLRPLSRTTLRRSTAANLRISLAWTSLAWISLAFALSGCSGRRYTYRTLPEEYLAAPAQNIEETGLTKLHVPAINSKLIDRGDVLEITITTNSGNTATTNSGNLRSTTTPVRVAEDGTVHVPPIGRILLAGFEPRVAEGVIAAAGRERGFFVNPLVLVKMERQYVNRITVIGPVKEEGVYELTRAQSSLLGALAAAGNLTEEAGPEITIRRHVSPQGPPGPLQPPGQRIAGGTGVELTAHQQPFEGGEQIIHVNLTEAAAAGSGGGQLQNDDVIIVSRRTPKRIYVMGLVREPGEYDLPPNEDKRLLDALAMAGERTMQAADKVLVIRRVPGQQEPVMIQISVRQAKANGAANLLLKPGDTIFVEETPITMVVKTVTDVIRIGIGGSIGFF